jgi:hypothetical protein
LGYIFACPCGPRFKAMFTLRGRLRDRAFLFPGNLFPEKSKEKSAISRDFPEILIK